MSLLQAWDQQQELCIAARDRVFGAPAVSDDAAPEAAVADERPPLRGFCDQVRRAGSSEVDTIRQRFDDRIVMAVKPGAPNP